MERLISLGYNAVPASARKAILDVFDSGQFSPGPKVKEFEEKFAKLHNAKHAVFVNSGTDALRIGLLAMKEKYGWKDGDLVAVPTLTFVATVNVIIQAGLKPFFADVSMHDYCINEENLKWRIETGMGRPVAVMPVHLFGQSCSDEIYELAERYGMKVLEDSCETILNPVRGDISCHSTYMAHHITTGVGGMAVTNSMELNLLMRSYANHGRNVSYLPGYFKPDLGRNLLQSRFRFDRIGYSCRGTEFEAALGLSQLSDLQRQNDKRAEIAWALSHALQGFNELQLKFPPPRLSTWMMYPIVLAEESKIDKYDLCLHLEKNGIETRDMMPITNQPCYEGIVNEGHYSVGKWINEKGLYIPCHPGMSEKDIEHIKNTFDSFFNKSKVILDKVAEVV